MATERDLIIVIPYTDEPIELLARSVQSAIAMRGAAGVVIAVDGDNAGPARELEGAGYAVPIHVYQAQAFEPALNGHIAAVGRAAALNGAIDCLSSDAIIALLMPGDSFHADAKARQVEAAIASLAGASFSGHHTRELGATWLPNLANDMWRRSLFIDRQFSASTMVFAHATWAAVGGFDETLCYGWDWDFAIRVESVIGWSPFGDVTGEVLADPDAEDLDGRSARRRRRRHAEDMARVHETGRALSHPDLYQWWHRKHSAILPHVADLAAH